MSDGKTTATKLSKTEQKINDVAANYFKELEPRLVNLIEQRVDETLKEFVPHYVHSEFNRREDGKTIDQAELTVQGYLMQKLTNPQNRFELIDAVGQLIKKMEANELHPSHKEAVLDHIIDHLESDRKEKQKSKFQRFLDLFN